MKAPHCREPRGLESGCLRFGDLYSLFSHHLLRLCASACVLLAHARVMMQNDLKRLNMVFNHSNSFEFL